MPDIDALQIININIDSIDIEDAGISKQNITTSATQGAKQSRKLMGLQSAVQTQTAFQNLLTIAVSQWLILMQTNQQNTFFQVQAMIQTKGKVQS